MFDGQKKDYKSWNFLPDEYTPFKQGIDLQREAFKRSMIGKDYDVAVICLENIKAEIKQKLIKKRKKDDLIRLQRIFEWYKRLPIIYTQKTEDGLQLIYPIDIEIKIQRNLNIAYEIIINDLNVLGLI